MKKKAHVAVNKKESHLITYLAGLSLLFFIVQLAAFVTTSSDVRFVFTLLHKRAINIPMSMLLPQLGFVLAQIAIYATLTVYTWAVARLAGRWFHLNWQRTCELGFAFWFANVAAIIIANRILFPGSALGLSMSTLVPMMIAKITLGVLCGFIVSVSALAMLQIVTWLWQKSRLFKLIFLLVAATFYLVFEVNKPLLAKTDEKNDQPNIIFIGIDSLRPDYTRINEPNNPSSFTPHLDQFLQSATVFTNAITPLARTYPSWTAILTGQYPVHNGVRFNLQDQRALSMKESLENLLKAKGYTTYYATDERRFSNISPRFGFDHIIGPDMGVNDFILGTINDLPLSNLIVNTPLGPWLFPYNAGNRAAYHNYRPQTFNDMVEAALLKEQHRPLFLAIHFCLPHWPYSWGDQQYDSRLFPAGMYALAAKRSDQQAAEFIHFLQQHHFLDHAIVVVLSDHGEGLLKPHDRLVNRKNYLPGQHSDKEIFGALDTLYGFHGYHFDTSYGHGSDVLSFAQYHTVLAFRTFGLPVNNAPEKIAAPVSELDIKPTILAMLNLASPGSDGISLKPFIDGSKIDLSQRILSSETGFNPIAMAANQIDIKGTVLQGIQVFQVNPSCAMVMKPETAANIIPSIQRVVLYQNWVLALYPQKPPKVVAVLVNRTTGQWTDDLGSPFAQHAPLKKLMDAMESLYGNEVTQYCPYLKECVQLSAS